MKFRKIISFKSAFLKQILFKQFSLKIDLPKSPLLETSHLKQLIKNKVENLRILDCTWFQPNSKNENPKSLFLKERIINSDFFDLNEIRDISNELPVMLPKNQFFRQKMVEMDIRNDDIIVCLDRHGIYSSPRVWFTFKIFGAKNVYVLNGGYPKCVLDEIQISNNENNKNFTRKSNPSLSSYEFQKDETRIHDLEKIFEISEGISRRKEKFHIIDMRPFEASPENNTEKENPTDEEIKPTEIKRRRQIAGSDSLPYELFLNSDQTFKSSEEICEILKDFDINPSYPTTFCSEHGVSACIGILAYELMGYKNTYLYDASMAEYVKNQSFRKYRENVLNTSPNEITDQLFDQLPKDQRIRIEMQRMMINKTKEMDRIKREMNDKKQAEKYQDDYEVDEKLY